MTHAYAGANGTVAFLAGKESYETAFASAPLTVLHRGCVSAALLRTRVKRIPLRELWECQRKSFKSHCEGCEIVENTTLKKTKKLSRFLSLDCLYDIRKKEEEK